MSWSRAVLLALVGLPLVAGITPAAAQPLAAESVSCPSGDFCAWSGPNYTGTKKTYYICQTVLPFASGTGSIFNNQTGGAVTTFTLRPNPDGATHMYLAAGYGDSSWSWAGTKSVRTC